MADDTVQKLLQGAIKAARQGDRALARKAFLQVLKIDGQNESAWLGLVTVSDDKSEQARILQRLLQLNPDNDRAKEAARRLGFDLTPEEPTATAQADATSAPPDDAPTNTAEAADVPAADPPADESPAVEASADAASLPQSPSRKRLQRIRTDELRAITDDQADASPIPDPPLPAADPAPRQAAPPERNLADVFANLPRPLPGQDGIPVPDSARVNAARAAATQKAAAAQNRLEANRNTDVQWVVKNRGRAGERDYFVFLLRIGGAVAGIILIVGIAAIGFALTRPEVREVVFAPTSTATPSPTVTPTNTPGSTPTSSPTPRQSPTPTPTLPLTVTPGNPDPNFPPEPTSVYVPVGDVGQPRVAQAAELMQLGRYEEAFDILDAEREATASTGNFVPYYWLSIWYLEQGDIDAARQIVDEGEDVRAGSTSTVDYTELVNTARARIDLFEARALLQDGQDQAAEALLLSVEEQITFVVEQVDPRIADAYLVLAERHEIVGDDEAALGVLSQAISSNRSAEIFTNTRLRLEIARIQNRLGNYDVALQEVNEVLYLNPFLESALGLRVQLALNKGDAGLGVLYSQAYLFYHPDSVRGLQLLGDSREAEFKSDQAIDAYTQGLAGDSDDPAYVTILQNRAAIYQQQGRYDLALEDLNTAVDLDDSRQVLAQRMLAAYRAGELETASDDATALIRRADEASPVATTTPAPTEAQADPEATEEAESIREPIVTEPDIIDPTTQARLMQARIFVDEDNNLNQARDILNELLFARTLSDEDAALAQTLLARIAQDRRDLDGGLNAIERAITLQPSAERHSLRGQLLEARGTRNNSRADLETALREFMLAQTLAQFIDVPFAEELTTRITALEDTISELEIEVTAEATESS